ncbi:MAG: hypothetical protein WCQ99_16100 [Pseudomonadota bacterium]
MKKIIFAGTIPFQTALFLLFFVLPCAAAVDHTDIITSYEGSKTCLPCHEAAVEQISHSLHYRILGPTQGIYDYLTNKIRTGEYGKGNRYCGLPGGIIGANWAGIWTSKSDSCYSSQELEALQAPR